MKTEGANGFVQFGSRRIPYRLEKSGRKRLRIVVSPDLSVEVLAPKTAEDDHICNVVREKAAWIAKKLDKLATYHPLPVPKNYISGESLVYLGRQYRLKVEEGENLPAKLHGRYLRVQSEDKRDTIRIKRAVDAWYRKRALETLGRYLEKWYVVASRHGITKPEVTIRKMRTRWGSCSPGGRITLNTKLVQTPVHCIEYVVIHELCHLKHHNHSKGFYSLLTRCQPDWKKRKDALERFKLA